LKQASLCSAGISDPDFTHVSPFSVRSFASPGLWSYWQQETARSALVQVASQESSTNYGVMSQL
jgi:hypothetical protein